jgi:hypothetical protein
MLFFRSLLSLSYCACKKALSTKTLGDFQRERSNFKKVNK